MAKYPVVVYGASGYTGMLIMDWLIDQNIPEHSLHRCRPECGPREGNDGAARCASGIGRL
jgi:hypothetical protein